MQSSLKYNIEHQSLYGSNFINMSFFYVNIEEKVWSLVKKYWLTKTDTDRSIKTTFWREYGKFN
jgi:hypothetical protein